MQFRQDVGSTVFVAIEGRLDSFYKGTVEQLGPDSCTVLYNETEVSKLCALYPQRNHVSTTSPTVSLPACITVSLLCKLSQNAPPCNHSKTPHCAEVTHSTMDMHGLPA